MVQWDDVKREYHIYLLPFQSYWKSFSNNLIYFHSKNQIWVLSISLFAFFQANHEYHLESISSSSSSSLSSIDGDNFTSINKQSQCKIISGLKSQGCKWLSAITRYIPLLWYNHLNQWFSMSWSSSIVLETKVISFLIVDACSLWIQIFL